MSFKEKYLICGVYIFNVSFLVIGLLLVSIGVWSELSVWDMQILVGDKMMKNLSILLMVCGSVVTLQSFIGIIATNRKKRKILLWVSASMMVVVILKLAGGFYASFNHPKVQHQLQVGISNTVTTSYGGQSTRSRALTKSFDWTQKNMKCCGADGAGDWKRNSAWYKNLSRDSIELVPPSCCIDNMKGCNAGSDLQKLVKQRVIYERGCLKPSDIYMTTYYKLVCRIALGVAFIQLVGVLLVYWLSRKLKAVERRRDDPTVYEVNTPLAVFHNNRKNSNKQSRGSSSKVTNVNEVDSLDPEIRSSQESINRELKEKLNSRGALLRSSTARVSASFSSPQGTDRTWHPAVVKPVGAVHPLKPSECRSSPSLQGFRLNPTRNTPPALPPPPPYTPPPYTSPVHTFIPYTPTLPRDGNMSLGTPGEEQRGTILVVHYQT